MQSTKNLIIFPSIISDKYIFIFIKQKIFENIRDGLAQKIDFIFIYFIILKYILFFYYFIIIKNTDSSNIKKLIQKNKHFIAFLSIMLYNDFEY